MKIAFPILVQCPGCDSGSVLNGANPLPARREDCKGVRRRKRYTAGDAALQQYPRSAGTYMVRLASREGAMPATPSHHASRHGRPIFHRNALCPYGTTHCAGQHKDGRPRVVLLLRRLPDHLRRDIRRTDGMGEEVNTSRIRDAPSEALESVGQCKLCSRPRSRAPRSGSMDAKLFIGLVGQGWFHRANKFAAKHGLELRSRSPSYRTAGDYPQFHSAYRKRCRL